MGKAKQRKKLKRNREKCDENSRFSLAVSQSTGNWLIMIDDFFCYDSAMKKSDAEKVVSQLIDYEKNHPLPPLSRHISDQEYFKWTLKSAPFIDDVPAVCFAVNTKDLLETGFQNVQKVILDPNFEDVPQP